MEDKTLRESVAEGAKKSADFVAKGAKKGADIVVKGAKEVVKSAVETVSAAADAIKQKRQANPDIDYSNLGFGKYFLRSMLVMRYKDGEWGEAEIQPYAPLSLDPATVVFHYGQAVFEGLKAYRRGDDVFLFRPRDNIRRLNTSCDRLCIKEIDEERLYQGLVDLVKKEKDGIPTEDGTSLYIRPCIIATEKTLSVHSSREYLLFIILSPVAAYYENAGEGELPAVSLAVETDYVRSAVGGTGAFKAAGNYAASLKAGELALERGYDQVLWLDAANRRYVEEVGSMNIFFVTKSGVITPRLSGSILPGITRDSIIKLLRFKNIGVSEEQIDINRVMKQISKGKITEVFGSGTAAAVSPVGKIGFNGKDYQISDGEAGAITKMLYDTLVGIQTGKIDDPFGWVEKL